MDCTGKRYWVKIRIDLSICCENSENEVKMSHVEFQFDVSQLSNELIMLGMFFIRYSKNNLFAVTQSIKNATVDSLLLQEKPHYLQHQQWTTKNKSDSGECEMPRTIYKVCINFFHMNSFFRTFIVRHSSAKESTAFFGKSNKSARIWNNAMIYTIPKSILVLIRYEKVLKNNCALSTSSTHVWKSMI